MFLGPIFSYEMITGGRRSRYYLLRLSYALFLFFLLWTTYEEQSHRHYYYGGIHQQANIASHFFEGFTFMQLMVILLISPVLAAGTIAVERDRRTIEYLLATDLSNAEIVLGKLFARLLFIGSIIIVGLPILSIAMLMGGIAPDRLVMVFLLTLSTMIFVASCSITVSAWAPRARDAFMRAYLILFVLFTIPFLILALRHVPGVAYPAWSVPWMTALDAVIHELCIANPCMAAQAIFSNVGWFTHLGPWETVWRAVVIHLGASAVMLVGAVWSVRRVHLKSAEKQTRRKRIIRRARQRPLVWNNAMLWKECFTSRGRGRFGIMAFLALGILVLLAAAALIWVSFSGISDRELLDTVEVLAPFLGCAILLLVATRASGLIAGERDKDTWITLLSTPLTGRQIVISKILGNLFAHRWILVTFAALWIMPILRMPGLLRVMPVVLGILLLAATYVTVLGVNFSLRLRNSSRAMGATLAIAFLTCGGYLFFCAAVMSRHTFEQALGFSAVVPFLMGYPIETLLTIPYKYQTFTRVSNWYRETSFYVGLVGYTIAAAILLLAAIAAFQRMSGRRERRTRGVGP